MNIRKSIARFFLRDYFASKAMQAELSKPLSIEDRRRLDEWFPGQPIGKVVAYKAYQMADLMLDRR